MSGNEGKVQAEDGSWVPKSFYDKPSHVHEFRASQRERQRDERRTQALREVMEGNVGGLSWASSPIDRNARGGGGLAEFAPEVVAPPTAGTVGTGSTSGSSGSAGAAAVHHITVTGPTPAAASAIEWTSLATEPRDPLGFVEAVPVSALTVQLTGELRFSMRDLPASASVALTLSRGGVAVGTIDAYTADASGHLSVAGGIKVQSGDTVTFVVG